MLPTSPVLEFSKESRRKAMRPDSTASKISSKVEKEIDFSQGKSICSAACVCDPSAPKAHHRRMNQCGLVVL